MSGTTVTPLPPETHVPADSRLAAALPWAASPGASLVAVTEAGSVRRAVLKTTLREALQDRLEPSTPIGALASERLVADAVDAAELRLAGDRGLGGVVVADGGRVLAVERAVPDVRAAVVMAGGFGTRLRPLTDALPKPLLEVGGRPLLCRILDQLRAHGVTRVWLSVHYLKERVRAVVGDGAEWSLEVRYLEEQEPLGTGAALALLTGVEEPFYLMNGDILTGVDLRALGRHHLLQENAVTVGTYLYSAPLPYGVVHLDAGRVASIEEKPVFRYPVNAGVYCFSPAVLQLVEHGRPLPMVDFLNRRASMLRIGRFAIVEYWNDVGSLADYERAQREVADL